MKIKIHHRNKLGDGTSYYKGIYFNRLKRGDYYWVEFIGNDYRVLFKIGNYVVGFEI